MKSTRRGKSTSKPEIINISEHGFWLFHEGREYFLDFGRFPWFRKATIEQIVNVQLQSASHLYWPELDVDLSFHIIEDPDKYKLVSK
jgi:hypothetical protein